LTNTNFFSEFERKLIYYGTPPHRKTGAFGAVGFTWDGGSVVRCNRKIGAASRGKSEGVSKTTEGRADQGLGGTLVEADFRPGPTSYPQNAKKRG